jgi:hypothetical protein
MFDDFRSKGTGQIRGFYTLREAGQRDNGQFSNGSARSVNPDEKAAGMMFWCVVVSNVPGSRKSSETQLISAFFAKRAAAAHWP